MDTTIGDLLADAEIFGDGDWVESKDQDPNGDVRLIQLADIGDGCYLDKSSRFLTSKRAQELRCTFLEPGDILVARMPDPLGRACIFPGDVKAAVTVVDVCVIRVNCHRQDAGWLVHAINSPMTRQRISEYISGTTRQRISRGNLAKIKLSAPSLHEQRRIAAILDKAHALRAKRREAIAKLDQLLLSVFLEMFGDPNSPKCSMVALDEVCTKITDGAHFTPTYVEEGVPFLRVTDIHSEEINWAKTKRIPLFEHEELIKRCRPERGDVLYSKNGTIGIPKLVTWNEPFSIFVSLALLKPDPSRLRGEYLESFLGTPLALNQAVGRSKTGTVTNLHLVEIRQVKIPLPSPEMQDKWIRIRRDFKKQRDNKIQSLAQLERLIASIQHKAFS